MQSIVQYHRLRRKTEATFRRQGDLFDTEKDLSRPKNLSYYNKCEDYDDRNGTSRSVKGVRERDFTRQPVENNDSLTDKESPKHPNSDQHHTGEDRLRLGSERTVTSQDEQGGNTNDYDYSETQDPKTLPVEFEGDDDPENPRNWPASKKWIVSGILGCTWALVGWNSAISSAVAKQIEKEFGVSAVTESLSTGLYLIALGLGSWITAPYSETFGRNPLYIISLVFFMGFIVGHALAPNIGAQLAFQFLAGLAGSTPYTAFGGSLSDMWSPLDRTYVFPLAAGLSFLGPFLAPMVGAFIGQSPYLSWRWTEWITLMMAGVNFVAIILFVPETHAPMILKWKAENLRRITGDDRYATAMESNHAGSTIARLFKRIHGPFLLLMHEIMLICFTVYLTVVYIVLYTFLKGYDWIYANTYGLSATAEGLCWIGLDVGFVLALALVLPFIYRDYKRKCEREREPAGPGIGTGTVRVAPEQRLWFAIIGAPGLPIALFFMAWTSYGKVSYWCSIAGSAVVGFSVQCIYVSIYQYIIDAYEAQAASALVGVTFTSYAVSGGMIPVSVVMYRALDVQWTLTLLGVVAALLTPIPFVFYHLGPRARERSRSAQ